jgi:ubiquinone/menaquinone biosynthesis C-methylase UbiE
MMLMLTLRGTPTLYYGDELGMVDVPIPLDRIQDPFEKLTPDRGLGRDPERTPMQWDATPNAGFCPAGVEPWLPLADSYGEFNVAEELENPRSMLTLTSRLLGLRRAHPALHSGSYRPVDPAPESCFVYLREDQGERFLVALNFSAEEVTMPALNMPGGEMVVSTHLDRDGRVDLADSRCDRTRAAWSKWMAAQVHGLAPARHHTTAGREESSVIHHAAQAFDQVADAYERGRPSYPADAVAHLIQTFTISSSSTVLDLAAGTGKFTQLLVSSGARIIAVEPLEGMRAKLAAHNLAVEILSGSAEAVPLADASVDVVTIAQAFHWFANERALAEIHRVLRPGGGLALIWNRRDTTAGAARARSTHGAVPWGRAEHRSAEWRALFNRSRLFTPLEEWSTPHARGRCSGADRSGTVGELHGSPAASRPCRHRTPDTRPGSRPPGPLTLKYTTDAYCCRAR